MEKSGVEVMPKLKRKPEAKREIIETRLLMGYNLTVDEYNTGELELGRYYVDQG